MRKINLFSFLLCILIFTFSCKKEVQVAKKSTAVKNYTVEQAFPNLSGEHFTAKWNNREIKVENKGDKYIWLGDIAFDQKTFDSLSSKKNSSSRTFKPDLNHLWNKGIVFFTIDNNFTAGEQSTRLPITVGQPLLLTIHFLAT